MNILVIGASSEIADEFVKRCIYKKDNIFLVTRKTELKNNFNNVLIVDDYLSRKDEIVNFIKKIENLYVIFFNGALFENRPILIPTKNEVELTKLINFNIPYQLFNHLNNHINNIEKFVFISTMAAVRIRNKNFIYGKYKRKLEEAVLKRSNKKVLILRFGKVFTNMSEGHTTPPFSLSSSKAAEKIYKNLNKCDIIYPSYGLYLTAILIKFIPNYVFKRLKI